MESKKKQIKFLIFILICSLLYSTWAVYGSPEKLSNEDFIRFHVIANSDSEEDQQLKMKVKDEILAKINNELVMEAMAQNLADYQDSDSDLAQTQVSLNLEQSRKYILENIDEIEDKAEKIIKENGYDYTAKAELGVKWIPEKTYGDNIFPAGNYEALHITIGEGKGENWWCVLFPPLCLIGIEEKNNENTTQDTDVNQLKMVKEVYQDVLLNKKYEPLLEARDNPATLKLKFKTLELIGE